MKPSRIFLSSRCSTAPHQFHFLAIRLVVHDIAPPKRRRTFSLAKISNQLQLQ
jgi:hypothetical protein